MSTTINKSERNHLPPVAWLLGRQLLASLKWILLYTAFGTKLDARDWMDAAVYPSDNQSEADEAWRRMTLERREGVELPDREPSETERKFWQDKGEFWFDYLSDTGDGTMATYSIAYLSLSNLWMRESWESGLGSEDKCGIQLEHLKNEKDGFEMPLPRGEFLLIGGDTSYHLSDYATLHLRFQNPFNWAYADLQNDLSKVGKLIDHPQAQAKGLHRRPLFGIPGNHDYYDMLDGFRRQFRTPVYTRPENKTYGEKDLSGPQLMLSGFKREQDTSYIALRLPFGWMLWGLDTEVGKIDERQRDFFKATNNRATPERLIVATSAPTTVFGKCANRNDEKCSKAFYQLGLARPFVKAGELEQGEPQLLPEQIRLDIAGDVHQYARYWGPGNTSINTRATAKSDAPQTKNYASVVSGLGGAFHHPTTTYVDEVKEQALYPKEGVSRAAVAPEIFNPLKVFRGGGVGVIGAVIALMLAFAAIANDSSRPAIHNFVPFVWLGLTQPERYESTVVMAAAQKEEESAVAVRRPAQPVPTPIIASDRQPQEVVPFVLWRKLGVTEEIWKPVIKQASNGTAIGQKCSENKLMYLWGDCSVVWPIDYAIGMVMLIATLLVVGITLFLTERVYKLAEKQEDVREGAKEPDEPEEEDSERVAHKLQKRVLWILWPTLLLNLVLATIGVLSIIPYRPFITPFGNSLWVFLTLIWAVSSVIFTLRYSDWLFVQSSKISVNFSDWIITWALAVATLASLAVGLWLFGKNNLPAYLVADIIFVTVLLASFVGLIYVAVSMGGQHQKGFGKVGLGILGLWHWILQLGVALLLLKKGTWLTVILAVVIFFLFMMIGKSFLKKNYKWRLTTAWIAYGAVMLALPPLVFWWLTKWSGPWAGLRDAFFWPHKYGTSSFASYEWWGDFGGFWQLAPLAFACLLGAAFSCIWVGWYFAVCLRFNGHNNETGGAARIEHYKQFIRFRIRPNDLTGYVIAVDEPRAQGNALTAESETQRTTAGTKKQEKPPPNVRIVDVFRLTPDSD